jgi:hypothetical protein
MQIGGTMRGLRRFGLSLLVTTLSVVVLAPLPPAGATVTFGTAQNVSLGNQKFGGRMVAVAVDPRNSAHVMAASESGGLWERTSRLIGWTPVSALTRFQLNDVAIDANGTVFVTTQDDGVSGQTGSGLWMRRVGNGWGEVAMPFAPCATRMSAGHIVITSSRVIVAQTCGVLISSNDGQTWSLHAPTAPSQLNWTNVSVSSDGVNVAACGTDSTGFNVWIGNTAGWQKATLPLVSSPINDASVPPPDPAKVSRNLPLIGACSLAWSPTDPGNLVLTAVDANGYAHLLESDEFGLTGWVDISPFTTSNRPPFVAMTRSLSPGKPYLYWGDGFGVYRQRCSLGIGPDCKPTPETGNQCLDGGIGFQGGQFVFLPGRDDDGDGVVNEGCPARGSAENVDRGACKDVADSDVDAWPNDGCLSMERWDVGGHPDITDIAFVRTINLLNRSVQDCPTYLAGDGGIKWSAACGVSYADDNHGLNAFQDYEVAGSAVTQSAGGVHLDVVSQDNGAYVSTNGGTSWTNPIDDLDVAEVLNDSPTAPYKTVWTQCVACSTLIHTGDIAKPGAAPFPLPTGTAAPKWNDVIASWGPNRWATFGPGTVVGTTRLYVSTSSTSVSWTGVGTNISAPLAPRSLRVAMSQGVPTFYFTLETTTTTPTLWKIVGTSTSAPVTFASGTSGAPTASRLMQPVVTCAAGVGGFRCPAVYAVDPSNPQRLMAADAFDSTIKVSTDGGVSWSIDQLATARVTNFGQHRFEPTAMAIDPTNGATMLIGTARSGVIASNNGGLSWVLIVGTLNNAPFVTSFYFDYYGQRIWFTTFGRGLWRIPAPRQALGGGE